MGAGCGCAPSAWRWGDVSGHRHLRILLRLERIEKYGPGSERLSDAQLELLELEPGVAPREIQLEADLPEPEKRRTPRSGHRGMLNLPPELPREEVLTSCHEKDCTCPQCHVQHRFNSSLRFPIQAIERGIAKINICTDIHNAWLDGIAKARQTHTPSIPGKFHRVPHERIKAKVKECVELFRNGRVA